MEKKKRMKNKNDFFYLGKIVKKIGFKGWLSIKIEDRNPFFYQKKSSFLIELNNKLVPYFIDIINHSNNNFFKVKFKNINNEHSASKLCGCKLYLPLHEKNKISLDLSELINYKVIDKNSNTNLGLITNTYTKEIQSLIEFKLLEKKILIPFEKEIVLEINKEKKFITVNLPNGITEL